MHASQSTTRLYIGTHERFRYRSFFESFVDGGVVGLLSYGNTASDGVVEKARVEGGVFGTPLEPDLGLAGLRSGEGGHVDAVGHDSKKWGGSSLNGEEQLTGGAVNRLPFVTPSGQNDELFFVADLEESLFNDG